MPRRPSDYFFLHFLLFLAVFCCFLLFAPHAAAEYVIDADDADLPDIRISYVDPVRIHDPALEMGLLRGGTGNIVSPLMHVADARDIILGYRTPWIVVRDGQDVHLSCAETITHAEASAHVETLAKSAGWEIKGRIGFSLDILGGFAQPKKSGDTTRTISDTQTIADSLARCCGLDCTVRAQGGDICVRIAELIDCRIVQYDCEGADGTIRPARATVFGAPRLALVAARDCAEQDQTALRDVLRP